VQELTSCATCEAALSGPTTQYPGQHNAGYVALACCPTERLHLLRLLVVTPQFRSEVASSLVLGFVTCLWRREQPSPLCDVVDECPPRQDCSSCTAVGRAAVGLCVADHGLLGRYRQEVRAARNPGRQHFPALLNNIKPVVVGNAYFAVSLHRSDC